MGKNVKLTLLLVVLISMLVIGVAQAAMDFSVHGGGQLIESEAGTKRQAWHVVSFGGWAQKVGSSTIGEWQVNFHNVGANTFDKSSFHGSDVFEMNYFPGNSNTCDSAMNLKVRGEWNQQPGYWVWLRGGDLGSPGKADTVRVTLYNDATMVYDTHGTSEFSDGSSCVGGARTGLDAGNLTISTP